MTGLPLLLLVGLTLGQVAVTQSNATLKANRPQGAPSQKNPYRTVFQTTPLAEPSPKPEPVQLTRDDMRAAAAAAAAARARAEKPQPKVVCGMLILPADASIDPGILIDPASMSSPNVPRPNHTIRSLQPEVCGPQ